MFRKETLAKALKIADKANAKARRHILYGQTQLENNELLPPADKKKLDELTDEEADKLAHWKSRDVAVSKLRELTKELIHPYKHSYLEYFENIVMYSVKFNIGNCHELACLALNHILETENIHAEIFEIKGGDHAIVILNRDPKTDIKSPHTWGDSVVICDPWSNKAYPLSIYLQNLKAYTHVNRVFDKDKLYTNHTYDFDQTRHRFRKKEFYLDTSYIRNARKNFALVCKIHAEFKLVLGVLETYNRKLEEKCNRYERKSIKWVLACTKLEESRENYKDLQTQFEIVKDTIRKNKKLDKNFIEYPEISDFIKRLMAEKKFNNHFIHLKIRFNRRIIQQLINHKNKLIQLNITSKAMSSKELQKKLNEIDSKIFELNKTFNHIKKCAPNAFEQAKRKAIINAYNTFEKNAATEVKKMISYGKGKQDFVQVNFYKLLNFFGICKNNNPCVSTNKEPYKAFRTAI